MAKGKQLDITSITYKHTRSLKFPSHSKGTPEDWAAFAGGATALLLENYSLATAFGDDVNAKVDPEDAGMTLLTAHEKTLYTAYKKKNNKPTVDWKRTKKEITGGAAHRRRWERFVAPLCAIYNERLSPEHVKAWAEKNKEYMPLLVGARKLEQAKRDGRSVKASSKNRVIFNELMSCRRVMAEIGHQRVKSSVEMKNTNKQINEREKELLKKLAKLETASPSDKHDAEKGFEARQAAWKKLTKTRTIRMTEGASIRRQNIELTALENNLRLRVMDIEERLESQARGLSAGPSSSSSKSKK